MNNKILEMKDTFQNYVIYYYSIDKLGAFSNLNKRHFNSKEEIINFIKKGNYKEIDNIYIEGKRVNYKIETNVVLEDNNE